jgi:thiol-disulfide isomerase/thioredoxin
MSIFRVEGEPDAMCPRSAAVILLLALGFGACAADRPAVSAEPGQGLPGILDFGQGSCRPCQDTTAALEELARRYEGRIAVRHLDTRVPENQDRADMYGVRFVPTQVFLDANGEERIRHEGVYTIEDLELELTELGWIPRP